MKKRGWDTQRKEEREHPQYEACKLTYEHSGKPRALSREESLGRREKNKKAQHREEHDDSEKPFINPLHTYETSASTIPKIDMIPPTIQNLMVTL